MTATDLETAFPCILSATDFETNGPGTVEIACGEPSLAVATFACVHEHIDVVYACAGCSIDLQRASGLIVCPRCEDAEQSHECFPSVHITWHDASGVTKVQEASA